MNELVPPVAELLPPEPRRRNLVFIAVVSAVLGGAVGSLLTWSTVPPSQTGSWEYHVDFFNDAAFVLLGNKRLDGLGAEGWEAFGVNRTRDREGGVGLEIIFKRRK